MIPKNQNTWYALYVRSRCERKVASRLSDIGIECYCPVLTELKQWSDRLKKVSKPVFSSYVFVHINLSLRQEVLNTTGVVGFVNWLNKPAEIRSEEIDAVREFLQQYDNVEVCAFDRYTEGDRVRIGYGPLNGSQGSVLRQKKHKVTLRIEQLGMDLIAELPKSHLQPIL